MSCRTTEYDPYDDFPMRAYTTYIGAIESSMSSFNLAVQNDFPKVNHPQLKM